METGAYSIRVPCYKPRDDTYMKYFSFFLGGSRKIPDLKEIARTASKDEKNVDTVLNRYGIYTEFSGYVNIEINVVVQSKAHMEESRNKIKEKQSREAYNLLNKIEGQVFGDDKESENEKDDNTVMQTKAHGIINRFSK